MGSYIGSVIKEVRMQKGFNRPQLANNICSVKYLYLIEKGDRTPSTEMTWLLGLKLGIDLFEYFEFLNCQDPVAVHDAIMQFRVLHTIPDFAATKALSDKLSQLPDFNMLPWKYEIEVNNAAYLIFVERRFQDGIAYIEPLLENMKPQYREYAFTANLLVALSSCYLDSRDIERACATSNQAEKIIKNKESFSRYNSTITNVKLNKMTLCNFTGDFDEAIEEGLYINRMQLKNNSGERANFTYYYLAYAYYKKGMLEEALSWFEKCLFDLIIHSSNVVAYFLSNYEHFYDMLYHPKTNSILAKKISDLYHLRPST